MSVLNFLVLGILQALEIESNSRELYMLNSNVVKIVIKKTKLQIKCVNFRKPCPDNVSTIY